MVRVSADKIVMKLLSSCLERIILSTIPTELTQNCVAGNLEFVNGKFATTTLKLTVLELKNELSLNIIPPIKTTTTTTVQQRLGTG